MPESQREITATRIALLDLKDEQQLVREGYELLDEKRILLASEIQRQLAQLGALRRTCATLAEDLRSRTLAAVGRHGLDELSVYPPLTLAADRVTMRRSRLFGLQLLIARFQPSERPASRPEQPVNPTPEARACAEAHRQWLAPAVELAACSVNLRRLVREYVRTERRARAIENVLMPEIESALKIIGDQLESMDQEEIARLRQRRGDSD
jgi:V/A-type H+-transporting ATPase subunit D